MIVLVCGSRTYNNISAVSRELKALMPIDVIFEGGATGADTIAAIWGGENGVTVKTIKAKWKEYGLGAGPIRNTEMLEEAKPDIVLAFTNDLMGSKGTKDMVDKANRAGYLVKLIAK